jgi:formate hydrogenlyase transcriptional activator
MHATGSERHAQESNAQVILGVAKAIGEHLELPEVLRALIRHLRPMIYFDAIAVVVTEGGDGARLHSLHVDSQSPTFIRKAAEVRADPLHKRIDITQTPLGFIKQTLQPYVCRDLEAQQRFLKDGEFLEFGIRSYIVLPLMRQGSLIGAVNYLSLQKRDYTENEIQLLQDVSEMVSIAVSNALAYEEINALKERLQVENRLLQDEIVQRSIFEEIVGSSVSLQKVLSSIDRVAPTETTVLITGETGTGKELVAHAIHKRSQRSGRALVKVNCAALPSDLIASELFGHEKGAFTGALQQRIGRFEAATGGTIFLDEIGELNPDMQISLLRVLQEREFERVGGNRTIQTDVRVIAATNRDLSREVADGRFRMDLYYRLNVFPVHVPSLRERSDDIPVLVDYFASRLGARMGKRIRQIDKATLDAMLQYSWPGNIRELQNVIERGVILADSDVFRLERGALSESRMEPRVSQDDPKSEIESVLRETRGRISGPDGAAARLGIPASTLESRIRALKINKHQFKSVI